MLVFVKWFEMYIFSNDDYHHATSARDDTSSSMFVLFAFVTVFITHQT